jgi:hypothetical protein
MLFSAALDELYRQNWLVAKVCLIPYFVRLYRNHVKYYCRILLKNKFNSGTPLENYIYMAE